MHSRMTTETVEQPRQDGSDHDESLKAYAEHASHAQLDDGNSATDSDADDSAPEPDDQDAALQQAHNEVVLLQLSLSLKCQFGLCRYCVVSLSVF